MKFVFLPPLIAQVLEKGFVLLEYRVAYYQVVVLFNAMILGMNLAPGLLSIVEVECQKVSLPPAEPADVPESVEIPLLAPSPAQPVLEEPGLNLLTEVYNQFERGAIDAEEYKRMRKQVVHEWHLARQTSISMN